MESSGGMKTYSELLQDQSPRVLERSSETVRRHTRLVRATHWINAIALLLLLASGLQIFNAHPALYWGQASVFSSPWLRIDAETPANASTSAGFVEITGHRFNTTGFLGASRYHGEVTTQAFPAWVTLPAANDLATGRRWHFLMAWIFSVNLLLYLASGLVSGHLRRDLLPEIKEMRPRALLHHVLEHMKLRFPEGDDARRYNVLQQMTYLAMMTVVLPLIVATGCTMSPAVNAFAPWLVDLFGGRQSARSIHFILANLIVVFLLVHLAMVILSGAWNNIRSMITGRYVIRFREQPDER